MFFNYPNVICVFANNPIYLLTQGAVAHVVVDPNVLDPIQEKGGGQAKALLHGRKEHHQVRHLGLELLLWGNGM